MSRHREHAARQIALGEQLLDGAARQRAASTGETYEKAYAEVLLTPAGRAAHRAVYDHVSDAERGGVAPIPAAKAAPSAALAKVASVEAELDGLARAHSARTGMSFEKAYEVVVATGGGRRLYFEYCEAQGAAGR